MSRNSREDEIYDLAEEAPRAVQPVAARAQPQPVAALPLQYRSKKTGTPQIADPDTIKNLQMPMWLLAGGTAIEIIAAFINDRSAADALVEVGIELILGTAIMLAGILVAARLRGIDLGDFRIAAFKLAAIAVAPSAAANLASPLLRVIPFFGGLIGLAVEFVLYFALLGALFDLDESDTWYCVMVIFLVRLGVYFALLAVLARLG